MNYIGIDISLNSTAICIENNHDISLFSYNMLKPSNKYVKDLEQYVNIRHLEEKKESKNYSESEMNKLNRYDDITDSILMDVFRTIHIDEPTIIGIEGYSFSSNTSSILDIVCFSTLLRIKLLRNINDVKIDIIAPKSLKVGTCEFVYGYQIIEMGKRVVRSIKVINTNHQDVKGGDFKKHEMYMAMVDGNVESPITDYLISNAPSILALKSIPHPIDDLIDSIFACKYIKYHS